MCTVTFIPSPEKIFFTSNRDEKSLRSDAIPPATYELTSGKIIFPKDTDAGGTWIAAHENGNAIVLLNGALQRHIPAPPYRKSRGLILIDLIDNITPYNSFRAVNLNNIEPFTAILWDDNHLFECRWDGKQKHSYQLDGTKPHIWSSVTLYDDKVISKRTEWFKKWLKSNVNPSQENILNFHQFTGDGDSSNDLRMDRDGEVFTVSITSLTMDDDFAHIHYVDLKNNKTFLKELAFEKSLAGR